MGDARIKVIPLLVLVAMMAFSVRLVDFSLGVSSLSGAAQAKAAKKEEPKDKAAEKATEKHAPTEKPEENTNAKGDDHIKDGATSDTATAAPKEATSKWRDAKDESFGMNDVRKGVMDDIAERRKALDEKQRMIVMREALIRASKQELDQKYKELLHLRAQIEGLLDKQSEEEQKRILSLVKIYEGMKPKAAARIFNTLDLDVLVSVLSRMSERKLSPILAAMNEERARTVTIMLAEEKQLPTLP